MTFPPPALFFFCKVSFRRVHLETEVLEIDSSKALCAGTVYPLEVLGTGYPSLKTTALEDTPLTLT